MISSYYQIIIPIIALFINTVVQVLLFRYFLRNGLLKTLILGFITGLFCVVLFEFYLFFKTPSSILEFTGICIANIILYSSLGYCYFHFVNLGETARRIRILIELYYSQGGLSKEGILEKYNAKEIIKIRLKRLIKKDQIIYENNCYFVKGNPLMLMLSKVIVTMKLIVLGKRSEFH